MSTPPIIDCTICGRHFAAFNITWHLWVAHGLLVKGAEYALVYWRAVRERRISYP